MLYVWEGYILTATRVETSEFTDTYDGGGGRRVGMPWGWAASVGVEVHRSRCRCRYLTLLFVKISELFDVFERVIVKKLFTFFSTELIKLW